MRRFAVRATASPRLALVTSLALLLGLAAAPITDARPFDDPIWVDMEGLEFMSCWRLKEDDAGSSCYHGSGWYTGCADSCMIATIDLYDLLRFECDYRFRGRVFDVRSGEPVRDLAIHLLMPDQTRISTYTDGEGEFRIEIERPDTSCLVEQGFDELWTLPDKDGITLTSTFTEAFRERHPELEILEVPTQRFRRQH